MLNLGPKTLYYVLGKATSDLESLRKIWEVCQQEGGGEGVNLLMANIH